MAEFWVNYSFTSLKSRWKNSTILELALNISVILSRESSQTVQIIHKIVHMNMRRPAPLFGCSDKLLWLAWSLWSQNSARPCLYRCTNHFHIETKYEMSQMYIYWIKGSKWPFSPFITIDVCLYTEKIWTKSTLWVGELWVIWHEWPSYCFIVLFCGRNSLSEALEMKYEPCGESQVWAG